VGANPIRQSLQPEAIGAVMEVTKWLSASLNLRRWPSRAGGTMGPDTGEP
jgi:hypothetical protein